MTKWGIQLAVVSALFCALLVGSVFVLESGTPAGWLPLVVLAPVVPLLALPWMAVRYLRGVDELRRRVVLEGLAFGFVTTAVALLALGGLQLAGVASPSWAIVLVIHVGAGALGVLLAARRYA